jgi:hypothetical protein
MRRFNNAEELLQDYRRWCLFSQPLGYEQPAYVATTEKAIEKLWYMMENGLEFEYEEPVDPLMVREDNPKKAKVKAKAEAEGNGKRLGILRMVRKLRKWEGWGRAWLWMESAFWKGMGYLRGNGTELCRARCMPRTAGKLFGR